MGKRKKRKRVPPPTPDEIKARCEEVRSEWSENTENSRRCGRVEGDPYEFPLVPGRQHRNGRILYRKPQ